MQRKSLRLSIGGVARDVALGAISGGQSLVYNASTNQLEGGGLPSSPAQDDVPVWNGSVWTPKLRSVRKKNNNTSHTTTTYSDITDLTLPISRVAGFSFDCWLMYVTNSVNEGAGFRVNFTGGGTNVRYMIDMYTAVNTHAPLVTENALGNAPAPQTAGPGSGAVVTAHIFGAFTSAGAGTFSAQARAETGGANSVTVLAGSWLQVSEQ